VNAISPQRVDLPLTGALRNLWYYGPGPFLESRCPLISPIVFDIFVAIQTGATISLVPERFVGFSCALSSFIQNQKDTLVFRDDGAGLLQSPRQLDQRDLSSLRWVLFAGEIFPTKILRALMEKLASRYANLYGRQNECLRLLRSGTAVTEQTAPSQSQSGANTE